MSNRTKIFFGSNEPKNVTQTEIQANLRKQFKACEPAEVVEGLAWYKQAHSDCDRLSKAYGVSIEVTATVLAVLSAQKRWSQNVLETGMYLADNQGIGRIQGFYTTESQATAVRELLKTGKMPKLGPKVASFRENVLSHGLNLGVVTVDVWAIRHSCKTSHNAKIAPTRAQYQKIESAFCTVSRELGILPQELQAVLWVAARNVSAQIGRAKNV
jgi:membrane-bound lytic murein transglycosylase B